MMRLRVAVLVGLGALVSGCGGTELLSGGQKEGEVAAVATDDGGPSTSRSGAGGPSLSRAAAGAVPQGTVQMVASVAVVREDGQVESITDGQATVRLSLAVPDSSLLGTESVPVGRYTRARITVSGVSADVTGGLSVGGLPLSGLFRVDVGSQPLVLEAPIVMLVEEDRASTLVVDVNAAAWLAAADPLTRTVPAAAFRAAVRVVVR